MGKDRAERGAALIEFAVALPFLLVITLGVIDVGRAYVTSVALANAAREGAMYASLHPLSQAPGGGGCADPDNITYHARTETGTVASNISVAVSPSVGCATGGAGQAINPGDTVTVTASEPFSPLTPLIEGFTGPLTLSSSVKVVVQG